MYQVTWLLSTILTKHFMLRCLVSTSEFKQYKIPTTVIIAKIFYRRFNCWYESTFINILIFLFCIHKHFTLNFSIFWKESTKSNPDHMNLFWSVNSSHQLYAIKCLIKFSLMDKNSIFWQNIFESCKNVFTQVPRHEHFKYWWLQ